MTTKLPIAPSSPDIFGHPRGLTILFLTGMWEVFALAGMRAVLIFYLLKQLDFTAADAVQTYALAASAGLLLSVVGGILADKFLGIRNAVIIGALLMAAGNFMLISEVLLYPGLALISIGNGLLNPTLAAQVGLLYADGDSRRDRAYLLYKVGCNLGAFAAPLVCGTIGAIYGWSWAFLVTGIGMIISIAVFMYGRADLPGKLPLTAQPVSALPQNKLEDRRALVVIAIVFLAAVLFWTAYKQIESTLAVWIDEDVERGFNVFAMGFTIPAAWFQSVNPLLVFALAPLINWWWGRKTAKVTIADDLMKMILGALFLAAAFLLLMTATGMQEEGGKLNILWLLIALLPFTLGEMYFQPIAQAVFSRLAIRNLNALYMSIFNLTAFCAYLVTIWLGKIWDQFSPTVFFLGMAAIAVCSIPILMLARKASTKDIAEYAKH